LSLESWLGLPGDACTPCALNSYLNAPETSFTQKVFERHKDGGRFFSWMSDRPGIRTKRACNHGKTSAFPRFCVVENLKQALSSGPLPSQKRFTPPTAAAPFYIQVTHEENHTTPRLRQTCSQRLSKIFISTESCPPETKSTSQPLLSDVHATHNRDRIVLGEVFTTQTAPLPTVAMAFYWYTSHIPRDNTYTTGYSQTPH